MPNAQSKDQSTDNRCPYCGKTIEGDRRFCKRCVEQGFNNVYELTGRSNGWDRPKPHYRVVGRKAS